MHLLWLYIVCVSQRSIAVEGLVPRVEAGKGAVDLSQGTPSLKSSGPLESIEKQVFFPTFVLHVIIRSFTSCCRYVPPFPTLTRVQFIGPLDFGLYTS